MHCEELGGSQHSIYSVYLMVSSEPKGVQ